jgi:nucleoside-diphosphate-sugar epimerase
MQTILGANGVIGAELAPALHTYTDRVRLVARKPRTANPGEEFVAADLLDAEQTSNAVAGSDVVYLVAGLPYHLKTWREQWPKVMANVIEACQQHHAKLVFFDNVYALGRVAGPMTEETPMNPISRKGEVRSRITEQLLAEVKKGSLHAIIARSADFYGPNTATSMVTALVFQRLLAGSTPQCLVSDVFPHSYTYTPDAGNAVARLGNTATAFDQIWNLPTHAPALTGREFISLVAAGFGRPAKLQILSPMMLRMVGLFNGIVHEVVETLYQNDSDYLFDSGKFDAAFGRSATPYAEGIAETVRSMTGRT